MNDIEKALITLKETQRMQKSALDSLPLSFRPQAMINRDISAIELAISALEKQTQKEVKELRVINDAFNRPSDKDGICCECSAVVKASKQDYCHVCGQKLDWNE